MVRSILYDMMGHNIKKKLGGNNGKQINFTY